MRIIIITINQRETIMKSSLKQRRKAKQLKNESLEIGLVVMALIPLTIGAYVYGQIIAGV